MRILISGGAGFIGSAVVERLVRSPDVHVVVLDKLTYAATLQPADIIRHPNAAFELADICDAPAVAEVFRRHRPDAVMHLAAESHVDRSIDAPADFIRTNVVGTYTLLDAALAYWRGLDSAARDIFRFHHISTDEVYGSLGSEGLFTEETPYAPNSPYSASKAGSDHLVRAWHATYGLPVVISNCSNNYGPRQFPEKLIPLAILNAVAGRPLPIYGTGENVRDWLYVDDHAEALELILRRGTVGQKYNVGGQCEVTNIALIRLLCAVLDEMLPGSPFRPHENLIRFVPDRPGHDQRYAIDAAKIARELGWRPRESLESGLRKTVRWYLDNPGWVESLRARSGYDRQRLGLARS